MKCIRTSEDISKLGTILGVWAHPDDETFAMGGIMASAVNNGQKVICITATRGEKGVRDQSRWPAEELGNIRTQEFTRAMEILGVTEFYWLDFPDGDCSNISDKSAVEQIMGYVEKYRPDSIFTFGTDGLTGHPDHCCMSGWTTQAIKLCDSKANIYHHAQTHSQYEALLEVDKRFNIFFNIDKPVVCESGDCAICFELNDELYELKYNALAAMPSQFEAILNEFTTTLRPTLGIEAFREVR